MIRYAVDAATPPIDEEWAKRSGAVFGKYYIPILCFDWMSYHGWYTPVSKEYFDSHRREFTIGVQQYDDAPGPIGRPISPRHSPQHIDGDGV